MAHKAKVGGTGYGVTGGKTKVGGTNYKVSKGKARISGTNYNISFVDEVLNNNDWATIRMVSDAGEAANYWSVGDTKSIVINGTISAAATDYATTPVFSNLAINVFVLGFDHNSDKEGTNRIHFQIGKIGTTDIALCGTDYKQSNSSSYLYSFRMKDSGGNSGGWKGSTARTILGNNSTPTNPTAGTVLAALPSDLRAVMKSVTKYTDNKGGVDDNMSKSAVTATTDYLFLLSQYEIFKSTSYSNPYEDDYQMQYDYYAAGNSKVKYQSFSTSTTCKWWTRSLYTTSTTATSYCIVNESGSATSISRLGSSFGYVPAFCV